MKIVIDLTAISYHLSGIERYALCISEKILKQDKLNQYILVFRNNVDDTFLGLIDEKRIKTIVLKGNNKFLFYQWTLYKELSKIDADKFLFFSFNSPILFRKKGIINTIHDMGPWDASEGMKILQKWYWKISMINASKVSEKILTVSVFSKHRIKEILNIKDDLIYVIPSGVYDNLNKAGDIMPFEKIKTKYKLPSKYIMNLSTIEPRKNLQLLLSAFSKVKNKVEYDLVLVGRKGWNMDSICEQYKLQNRIHITGFVEDKDISSIYQNSLCFVFTSLYEGFGLPPLEALALGTPVISSNAASLPEVLMDRATYFESNNENELIKLLENLENNLYKMNKEVNEYQKDNYNYETSARKIINIINR